MPHARENRMRGEAPVRDRLSLGAARWAMVVAMLVAMASTTAAVPDREALLARARAIRERVSRGDTPPLWSEFDPSMRAAFQDSAAFAAMSAGIHAQLGSIDSVMSEEVTERDSLIVLISRCRFSRMTIPANLTVALTPSGRIASLRVRPDTQEYPSPYLDYVPQARFELPFRGEWWVAWGGRTLGENHHAGHRSQRFAYDLCMVKDGRTHSGDGKALTDYHCYGQPILAPAAGTVVTVVDSLPDQSIGSRDPAHAAGNQVVIDHGHQEFSLVAHLQPRSVRVRVGQEVKSGEVLGLTGNSGNTSEPHLHVHLMNGPRMEDSDGLPMPFSGYVLEDQVVERGELKRFQLVKRRER